MNVSVKTCFLLGLANLFGCAAAAPPNVILMMADDLGWGDLGCYNEKSPIQTPNLNAMAAHGLRFERFYAASAVCSPTRASCLTGRHPERAAIPNANAGHLRKEEITIQSLLKKAGYRTGHFGKWHLGTLSKTVKDANRGGPRGVDHYAPPWERDFDVCFSSESKVPTWDPMWRPKKAETKKNWWTAVEDTADANVYGTAYWNEKGEAVKDGLRGDDSAVVMDRALKFVASAAKDQKPFFAVVWFHTPHLPVVTGGKYAAKYAKYDGFQRSYYGCVTALDDQVGRLRGELARLGVAENTMLWFCSDNGPEGKPADPGQANGLRGRKRALYEGGVRVPGILEWPAGVGTDGRVIKGAAVTSDYLPTVLAATGIEYPSKRPLDGVNLLPVFKGSKRGSPIGFYYVKKAAWTDGPWKLVRGRGKGKWELYNLTKDPAEAKDLAVEHPERVSRMAGEFDVWKKSCEASSRGEDFERP